MCTTTNIKQLFFFLSIFPKSPVIKSFISNRRTKSIKRTGWDDMGLASSLSPPFWSQWFTDEAWQWLDQWRGTREEEGEQRRGGSVFQGSLQCFQHWNEDPELLRQTWTNRKVKMNIYYPKYVVRHSHSKKSEGNFHFNNCSWHLWRCNRPNTLCVFQSCSLILSELLFVSITAEVQRSCAEFYH